MQVCRVHDRASEELSKYGENPTELHRHLLRLFPEGGPLRIVTTNFDRLFEAAADLMFTLRHREFSKPPPFPVARGVNGVIHLHGSLDQPEDTSSHRHRFRTSLSHRRMGSTFSCRPVSTPSAFFSSDTATTIQS